MIPQQVCIAERFHGPPDSGNGGYVAGIVARALGGSGCTVTLLRPPPLERILELRPIQEGVALFDGEQRIASAAPAEFEPDALSPPSFEEARAAETLTALRSHPSAPEVLAEPITGGRWSERPDPAAVGSTVPPMGPRSNDPSVLRAGEVAVLSAPAAVKSLLPRGVNCRNATNQDERSRNREGPRSRATHRPPDS